MESIFQHRALHTMMAILLLAPGLLLAGQVSEQSAPPAPATPVKSEDRAPSSEKKYSRKEKKERKKHSLKTADPDTPRRIVVKEGGASETPTEVAPRIDPAKANYERESTTGLIAAAEANLERLKDYRLSRDQKATVEQIRLFVQQARAANASADFGRAHTLALKARVLSDDLLSH